MLAWLHQFRESTGITKVFIASVVLWTGAIIVTTIYCYARLDFVRSYRTSSQAMEQSAK